MERLIVLKCLNRVVFVLFIPRVGQIGEFFHVRNRDAVNPKIIRNNAGKPVNAPAFEGESPEHIRKVERVEEMPGSIQPGAKVHFLPFNGACGLNRNQVSENLHHLFLHARQVFAQNGFFGQGARWQHGKWAAERESQQLYLFVGIFERAVG